MNNKTNRKGLSLIELTISLGIFAVILLPVFFTFSSGSQNLMVTDTEFRAHANALELMEQLISLPFELIPVGKFNSDQIKGIDEQQKPKIPFKITENKDFKPNVEINEIKKNNKVVFKKISVSINFPASKVNERNRKIEIKTLVANESNK
ncbi:MAG: PilW family protein [Candidatus Rifleibacteriota bacterium]